MPKLVPMTPDHEDCPRIDPEFQKHLPALSEEQRARLRKSIIKSGGPRNPVVVWTEENIAIGGQHRLGICIEEKLPFNVDRLSFDNREDVIAWMEDDQLNQRNLTDEQRAYFIGRQYNREKKSPGHQAEPKGATAAPLAGKTAEAIAKKHGISPRTVHTDAAFAQAVDAHEEAEPGSKEKILAGEAGSKKKVIATAPLRCPDCTRKGRHQTVECSKCDELNAAKKKSKKVKKKQNAKVIPPAEVDAWDIPIQEHAAEAFEAVPLFKELVALLQSAQKKFNELASHPGGKFLTLPDVSSFRRGKKNEAGEHADRFVHDGIERAYLQVKNAMPTHTVCPWNYVDAPHPKQCATCCNLNWTPVLGNNIPESAKKRAKKEVAC